VRWPLLSIAGDGDSGGNCGGVSFARYAESGLVLLEGLSDERIDVLSSTRRMLHSNHVNIHLLPH
jgi:hypothetical protein